jgi:hypothetical protein
MNANSKPTHQILIRIPLPNIRIRKSGLEIVIINSFNQVPITIQFVNQWLMFDCKVVDAHINNLKPLYVLFNQVLYNEQLC